MYDGLCPNICIDGAKENEHVLFPHTDYEEKELMPSRNRLTVFTVENSLDT